MVYFINLQMKGDVILILRFFRGKRLLFYNVLCSYVGPILGIYNYFILHFIEHY